GKGDWLVIEADESDGSIVQYHPTIGLLLNIEKDHKELDELMEVFETFRNNSNKFIVNQSNEHAAQLSTNRQYDFIVEDNKVPTGFEASHFTQNGFSTSFKINDQDFEMQVAGRHNMENALAAVAAASQAGVALNIASEALKSYEGIYRRCQVLGQKNGIWVVDDFAHNPVKCAAAIRSIQPVATKIVAWFQPHGYAPTKFLRTDFVEEITKALRVEDEIWMSEIFYAGGTATKDISANDLINDMKAKGANAFFVEDRDQLLTQLRTHLQTGNVLLLMGARDPSLEQFAKTVFEQL
ncbi:MAG TPA: Mur ligase family protein, partial [Niabella sp.]|nr:Mur ligase family protein [Niabella sp.]